MGFITSTFDVKALARGLDRTPARQKAAPEGGRAFSELSDYVYENIALPMLQYEVLDLLRIDITLISNEDIELLYDAFNAVREAEVEIIKLCATFKAFPAVAVETRIII